MQAADSKDPEFVRTGVVNVGGINLPVKKGERVSDKAGGMEGTMSNRPHVGRGTDVNSGSMDEGSRNALTPDAPAAPSSLWEAGVWETGRGSNVERW